MTNPNEWKTGTSTCILQSMSLEIFRECKKAGMDCIDLGMSSLKECDFTEDKRVFYTEKVREIREADLELWGVHLPFGSKWCLANLDSNKRNKIIDNIVELLEWMADCEAKIAIIHASSEDIIIERRNEQMEVAKESLNILAEKAKPLGIQIAVECLPRIFLGNSVGEMEDLISLNDDLRICCDVNHLFNEKPEEFIEQLGHRIITTHLSDYDGVKDTHWIPGCGVINWNLVIDALYKTGYKGPFMFEVVQKNSPVPLSVSDLVLRKKHMLKEYNVFLNCMGEKSND